MSDESHGIEYRDGNGDPIVLVVPWGFHSGKIPPPVIEFHTQGGPWRFAYSGDIPNAVLAVPEGDAK